ncbi:MAG: AAA family ATPase [Verrucomicrobiae bacterium]|nr:AAA family ATPase [Verrucomicrobiae bacterium]
MNTFAPLPSATNSEAAAISCALQCATMRARAIRELPIDLFHLPAHRIIWGIVRELGDAADVVTIQQRLIARDQLSDVGGPGVIVDLNLAAPSAGHYAYYVAQIIDAHQRRMAIAGAERIIEAAQDPDGDFVQEAASALSEIASQRKGVDTAKDVRALATEYLDDFEARMEGRHNYGLRTRFARLNAITGGMPNGNLIVIAGSRGTGKSILAQNLGEDAMSTGKSVLWFSYEMPRREIMSRLIASQGNVPGRVLFDPHNNRPTQEHFQAMTGVITSMQNADLLRLRDQHLTVDEIRLETLDAMSRGNIRLILVDYLQLVPPTDPRASREQQVSTVSRKLRALALETDLPVIALSQLNREGDARESMAIEQDASVILKLIYPDEEARKAGDALLKIDKNRNGQSHVAIALTHERGFFRFTEKGPP